MTDHYTNNFLLTELVRFFNFNKRIPKSRELTNNNGYPNWSIYKRRFGSFKEALIKAGLPVDSFRERPKKYSSIRLILLLVNHKTKFGRFPSFSDLNKRGDFKNFPHVRTYEYRFGSLSNALTLATMILESKMSLLEARGFIYESILKYKTINFNIHKEIENTSNSKITLTFNEINHLVQALNEVYCKTCEQIKQKLIKKGDIYGSH